MTITIPWLIIAIVAAIVLTILLVVAALNHQLNELFGGGKRK